MGVNPSMHQTCNFDESNMLNMAKPSSFVFLFSLHCLVASLAWTKTNITTDKYALLALKSSITSDPYNFLANWSISSSPCDWVGVTCNTHHERVHSLNLAGMDLTGTISPPLGNLSFLVELDQLDLRIIPSAIGNVTNLQSLYLANSNLQGCIPKDIGNLHKLELLDIYDNYIGGPFPSRKVPGCLGNSSLWKLDFSSNKLTSPLPSSLWSMEDILVLDLSSNAISGTIPSDVSNLRAIIHKRDVNGLTNKDLINLETPIRISYYELLRGTNGFDERNLLGFGSYGSVYKANLSSEKIVAVKVFNSDLEEALRSFDIECDALCNFCHRNLVKIISTCSKYDFKSIIMEFMPNRSLDRWLYSHRHCLDILQRLNILIDVEAALEYLHHGSSKSVVHCFVKLSNVLLDEDMVAHLSDFGIAKLLGEG
ncbi:receptor kinase-like protein Xa21 [Prosopis cineraria]|uniref:receptor kinase-like protein Xa21 n=1 Tax=Prosopis cineraria TaxID=364024 RepID=UPI00240FE266|nr:receptor kinase-like protein Xa21 [Prosopis cineraria]